MIAEECKFFSFIVVLYRFVYSDSNTLSTQKSGTGIGVGMIRSLGKETLILAYSYIPHPPDVYASSVTVEYHLLCTYLFP